MQEDFEMEWKDLATVQRSMLTVRFNGIVWTGWGGKQKVDE